jgi:NADH-quinone oxidoreductase subunit H
MTDFALLAEWAVKSGLILASLLTGFAYLTLFERRVLARIQLRIGPNRAGPWGLLQPVADGVKLIFKEELIPDQADRTLFLLAPVITVVPALIIVAVVPLGPEVQLFGRTFVLGLADTVNVGVLYIMAVSSIAVYGIALAGWSSGNKYSTMGALRASAQMVSYELALGLAFLGPILLADSLSLREIVNDQSRFLSWYALRQPVGLFVFLVASIAELNRAPFDLPEAEQELTAGYHTEYSGMKFAMFYMAEYIKMIAVSAIAASLFLGGFWGPGVERVPWLGPVYLSLKIGLILFGMIWIRATLPRLRYDQLMTYGWKVLLPLGLLNLAWTAIWVVWKG